MATTKSKAELLLSKVKTSSEKASQYLPRIKRTLYIELTDKAEKINQMKDKLYDLENFSLQFNANLGQREMDKETCENKFREIMNLRYEISLLELEQKQREEIFVEYFGKETPISE